MKKARYLWLRKKLEAHNIQYASVIELGCYDGKAINYLPYPPEKYEGYDANFENGLDIFKEKWENKPNYQVYFSNSLDTFNSKNEKFDLAICMETLEHLPRKEIPVYLDKLARSCNQYAIITVPNEIGLLFFIKYILKLILSCYNKENIQKYTLLEFIDQTFGMSHKVEQNDHKGFNYKNVITNISNYFEIVAVEGTQFPLLPLFSSANIGVVCKKRK
ncbi:MAG: methyltransferase domain-containing protein [Gammaproteobacteria bacterium]|nr:methyltransferase domain-containing protein [Gammaproteobacteria bacterium]